MAIRILIDFLLFLAVFFLPPILPIIAALFFLYYFKSFYEIIFAGVIIDVLYSKPLSVFHNFSYPTAFILAMMFILSVFAKKWLKFYSDR